MRYKDFKRDFWMLHEKLKSGEPFAFSRYSDGELDILQNNKVTIDHKSTRRGDKVIGPIYEESDHKAFDPELHKDFREALLRAYKHHQDNYFVGLSCPCCVGRKANEWMKQLRGGDDEHLTWSNLLMNSNYPLFLDHMLPLLKDRKVVMICNETADLSDLPFDVVKDFRVGSNAPINDQWLLEELPAWSDLETKDDCYVFLFAAASLSNLLIHRMFEHDPSNTYIDIGSALSPLMKMPIARNYLRAYWLNSGNTEINKYCMW